MRKSIVFLSFIFLTTGSGRSQDLKFGFVEDQRILAQLPAVEEVQKVLDQETALWEKRFKERQQFLKACIDSFNVVKAELEKARQDTAKTSGTEKQSATISSPQASGDSATT